MKKHILAVISFVLFSSAVLLQLAARNITGFAEWYAVTVYPCIVGIYGRFCNIFPFSVVEIGIYALILFTAAFLVFCRKQWKRLLEGVLAFLGLIAFLFTVNCGINYYRRPFSGYLDLKIQDSSVEELAELCAYLVDRINETADDYGQPGLAVCPLQAGTGGYGESGNRISSAGRILSTAQAGAGLLDSGSAAAVRNLFPLYCGGQLQLADDRI